MRMVVGYFALVVATLASANTKTRKEPNADDDECYTAPGPAQPWAVACSSGGGNEGGCLRISVAVDATTTDMVSVELYPTAATGAAAGGTSAGKTALQRPNTHFVLGNVTAQGRLSGSVTSLSPDAEYRVAVRAHRQGCAEDGGNGTWSNLTWLNGPCRTSFHRQQRPAAARYQPPRAGTSSSPSSSTHWLEVFRFAEGDRTLPDFLDNHDSGDLGGDGAILFAFAGAPELEHTPITRYCVEVLNVTVQNTTTTTFHGSPVPSPYADYRSTNAPWMLSYVGGSALLPYGERTKGTEYESWCAMTADRYIGHQSRDSILRARCDTNACLLYTSPSPRDRG